MLPKFSMALSLRTMTPLCHRLRAFGQVDADDRRQQLWGHANSQGDREEQRIQDRLVQEDIDRKDHQHHHQHHLSQHHGQMAHAALELRFGGRKVSASAICPKAVRFPVCTITAWALPERTLVPM